MIFFQYDCSPFSCQSETSLEHQLKSLLAIHYLLNKYRGFILPCFFSDTYNLILAPIQVYSRTCLIYTNAVSSYRIFRHLMCKWGNSWCKKGIFWIITKIQSTLDLRNPIFPFLNWELFDLRKIFVLILTTGHPKKCLM